MTSDDDVLRELASVSPIDKPHKIQHYLYLPNKQSADQVASLARSRAFACEVRLGADGVNWLVLATHCIVPSRTAIDEARDFLEEAAVRMGGEYDGWEAAVVP